MATIISHPAVALGMLPWFSEVRKSKVILFIGILLTILPDIDVVGFRLGIAYGDLWGHRGMTHSLLFSVVVGALIAKLVARKLRVKIIQTWLYFTMCIASHGVLDAFTNGGLGVAFFSPFSEERYFFPVRYLEVSTLNIIRFFQGQGIAVIKSELIWLWLPCAGSVIIGYYFRKKIGK